MNAVTQNLAPAHDRRQETAEQHQARIDLAASQRLAVIQEMSEGIYNHFTLAVPGTDDRFYVSPLGLHWSEVTASGLLTVDYNGRVLDGDGALQRSAYCIHAPIHRRKPEHAALLHTHMPYTSALTRLKDQRLLPIGHTEAQLIEQIAYDEDYTGLARDPAEGERLADILGDKTILLMAHHGVLVAGRTVAEAYDRLYQLERSARVQLFAQWTGQPLRYLTDEMVKHVHAQITGTALTNRAKSGFDLHFDALKRLLDRQNPGYRD
ncbi:MAG: class II aldolase/adducin family protein [Chelatococcus sp.]|uniref:class II aldolase/adducin family protein n=1 Tax=Chelatococcus sp. TaxID=1953771 RepID=UPI0025C13374|nr:class II aldolase/adducin family protein [Chelatococcus sp.]MBX3539224.1 class II aldolase/adducin family protein [Chelatococcus sp.]